MLSNTIHTISSSYLACHRIDSNYLPACDASASDSVCALYLDLPSHSHDEFFALLRQATISLFLIQQESPHDSSSHLVDLTKWLGIVIGGSNTH